MNSHDHTSVSDIATLLSRFDDLHAGCDPDFDSGFEELERQFAELRLTFSE